MKLKTRTDKSNFFAQDMATRRVMLAQDCINSAVAHKIFADTNRHISIVDAPGKEDDTPTWGDDEGVTEVELCHAIHDPNKACVVCLRGGLLLSRIGYQHPVDTDCKEDLITRIGADLDSRDWNEEFFSRCKEFSVEQIGLMECTFEREYDLNFYTLDYDTRKLARDYGRSLNDDDTQRLMQIMQNVIDNNGEFVIPKEDQW